jgi:hypothetical protein
MDWRRGLLAVGQYEATEYALPQRLPDGTGWLSPEGVLFTGPGDHRIPAEKAWSFLTGEPWRDAGTFPAYEDPMSLMMQEGWIRVGCWGPRTYFSVWNWGDRQARVIDAYLRETLPELGSVYCFDPHLDVGWTREEYADADYSVRRIVERNRLTCLT